MVKHARLELARRAELLPKFEGITAVFGQIEHERLQGLDAKMLRCVNHSFVTTERLKKAGIQVARTLTETPEQAVVFLPRVKAEAWHLLADAKRAAPNGWLVVDGQKTDGIESIAKQLTHNLLSVGSYSKRHGKTIWLKAHDVLFLEEFFAQGTERKGEFITAPGVFSADGIDPASEFLMQNMPKNLTGLFADLGAGWGFLSKRLLEENPSILSLNLVEDNGVALDCARINVTDGRAEFQWFDALNWKPKKLLDGIIMNPPFHKGHSAEPELGKDFIKASSCALHPGGKLYMVANAHLPYETVLEQCFATNVLLARSNQFKVFCARRGHDKRV